MRFYPFIAAVAMPAALSACGGANHMPPSTPGNQPHSTEVRNELTSDTACSTNKCLYVTEFPNPGHNPSEVLIFAATARGNTAPIAKISGTKTGLDQPTAIFVDPKHRVYVTNNPSNSSYPSITVYAAGAFGNVTPVRTIQGSKTQMRSPAAIAVDSGGNILVANDFIPGSITVYAAGATRNASPIATIVGNTTDLQGPQGIALGPTGKIYVTNFFDSGTPRLTVYAKGADGDVAPIQEIDSFSLADAVGIGIGLHQNIYVANHLDINYEGSVQVYGAHAQGRASPIRSIVGSKTELNGPTGLALDAAGDTYIANASGGAISIYGPKANGNVKPIGTITGTKTGLGFILDLALR